MPRLQITPFAVALALCAAGTGVSSERDGAPPTILVRPLETGTSDLTFRVQINDASGVRSATLWVKSEQEAEYRPTVMTPNGFGEYEAVLPLETMRGAWLAYYFEAVDRSGNPPARNGDRSQPFVARREDLARASPPASSRWVPVMLALLSLGALVLWLGRRGDRRQPEPEPLAPPQVRAASLASATPERIEEELFWFRLLAPIANRPPAEQRRALRDLAGRIHAHPTQGRRVFSVPTLSERLAHVRTIDARELLGAVPEAVGARESAGMSLIELSVVLGLLVVVLGLATISLRSMEAPLVRAGHMLDGIVKQTRSMAMSGTTAQRLRPINGDRLVVEHAPSCSSMAWTLDPRMELELPRGVALSDTAWSVCFDSRGIASDNIMLTLNHEDFASRQFEILKGGLLRWEP